MTFELKAQSSNNNNNQRRQTAQMATHYYRVSRQQQQVARPTNTRPTFGGTTTERGRRGVNVLRRCPSLLYDKKIGLVYGSIHMQPIFISFSFSLKMAQSGS